MAHLVDRVAGVVLERLQAMKYRRRLKSSRRVVPSVILPTGAMPSGVPPTRVSPSSCIPHFNYTT